MDPVIQALLLGIIGFLAAVVNTMAGGGTLLVVPAMILMGFSPLTANATNRLTLVVQGAAATAQYRRKRSVDIGLGLRLSAAACVPSVAGAYLATALDEQIFRWVLAVLLIGSLGFLLLHPASWFADRAFSGPPRHRVTLLGFIFVGFYGGFFGAGVGAVILLLLAAAQQLDLVAGNAIKAVVITALSLSAAAVFAWLGKIDYAAAIPLAVGSGLGGWLGAHLALKGGDVWIRRLLLVVVIATVYKLLA